MKIPYCLHWSIQNLHFLAGHSIFRREKPFAGEQYSGELWGHLAGNKQKQCTLGYGWRFPPKMAALVQSQ